VEKGVEGDHAVTRPSAFVVALNFRGVWVEEEVVEEGLWSVRVTGMEAAGRPSVVSRTWHVIGGLAAGVDIVVAVGLRCVVRAEMRVVGDEAGMRWWLVCAVGICTAVVRILGGGFGRVDVV